jgi:hypothetical protein
MYTLNAKIARLNDAVSTAINNVCAECIHTDCEYRNQFPNACDYKCNTTNGVTLVNVCKADDYVLDAIEFQDEKLNLMKRGITTMLNTSSLKDVTQNMETVETDETDGVLICADCGCEVDENDVIIWNGKYYCSDCVSMCEECGKYYFSCDSVSVNMGRYSGIVCSDCADSHFMVCENCGEYYYIADMTDTSNGWVCENCLEDYIQCPDCGTYVHGDNMCYSEIDNEYYCDDCLCNHERDENMVQSYHSGHNDGIQFYANHIDKPVNTYNLPEKIHMSFELETDKYPNSNEYDECAEELSDGYGKWLHMENDGSLDNGIEIIIQPHSYDYLINSSFINHITDVVSSHNGKSYHTNTCGFHVHVNKAYLNEYVSALIINKIPDAFLNFGQRSKLYGTTNLKLSNDEMDSIKRKSRYGLSRYNMVNVTNSHTTEFRFFKGTTCADTIKCYLMLVHTVAELSKLWDEESINNMDTDTFVGNIIHELRVRVTNNPIAEKMEKLIKRFETTANELKDVA